MQPLTVSRTEYEKGPPYAAWHISWYACVEPQELTPVQQVPHYIFRLDGEVHNGGYWQYLSNLDDNGEIWQAEEALGRLREIGLNDVADDLAIARDNYLKYKDVNIEEDDISSRVENDLNVRYYDKYNKAVDEGLQRYLKEHFDGLVKIV